MYLTLQSQKKPDPECILHDTIKMKLKNKKKISGDQYQSSGYLQGK